MKRVHLIVHGSVQGVFFRANAARKAIEPGLRGYAKNMADSSVEIVAEGNEKRLNELIEFCRKNPGASKVSKVDIKFENFKNEFNAFEIKY